MCTIVNRPIHALYRSVYSHGNEHHIYPFFFSVSLFFFLFNFPSLLFVCEFFYWIGFICADMYVSMHEALMRVSKDMCMCVCLCIKVFTFFFVYIISKRSATIHVKSEMKIV